MAGSVIVTVGDAKGPLFDALLPKVEALTVGDGMEKGVSVGPVVSTTARDRIMGMIEKGIEARRDAGRRRPQRRAGPNGAFVGPTIIDGVTPDMEVAQEEIFGPVLTVLHADSLEQAIEIVNSSRGTATARRSSRSRARPSAATAPTSRWA